MSRSKIIALAAAITFGFGMAVIDNAVAGEKFKLRTIKYADKWEQIQVGDDEGHNIIVEEAKGIVSNMEGKAFGDGWVMRHFGLVDWNATTGVAFGHGYEEVTDRDGDKFFTKWEGKSTGEATWEGEYTVLKGTGKYEGIKGKGTWSLQSVAPMQWYTDEEWDIELP
jgi:hypothetical protein